MFQVRPPTSPPIFTTVFDMLDEKASAAWVFPSSGKYDSVACVWYMPTNGRPERVAAKGALTRRERKHDGRVSPVVFEIAKVGNGPGSPSRGFPGENPENPRRPGLSPTWA